MNDEPRHHPERSPASTKRWIRWAVSAAVTAAILAILIRSVEAGNLGQAFRRMSAGPLVLAGLLHLLVVLLVHPIAWHRLLHHMGYRTALRPLIEVWIGTASLKSLLPFKMGRIVCANYLRVQENVPLGKAVGSLLFLQLIHFYGMWVWVAVGLAAAAGSIGPLPAVGVTAALIAAPALLLLPDRFAALAGRFGPRFEAVASDLAAGFSAVPLGPRLRLVAVLTALRGIHIVNIALALAAVGISVPVQQLLLRAPWVYILPNIPVTLMGAGAREATMVYLFNDFGPEPQLLATGLSLTFLFEIVPIVLALPLLPKAVAQGVFSR